MDGNRQKTSKDLWHEVKRVWHNVAGYVLAIEGINYELTIEAVKKDMPAISLATVYRNLNSLADNGEILKLEINGEAHYDGFCHLHSHFVCNECGKIIDIEINYFLIIKKNF